MAQEIELGPSRMLGKCSIFSSTHAAILLSVCKHKLNSFPLNTLPMSPILIEWQPPLSQAHQGPSYKIVICKLGSDFGASRKALNRHHELWLHWPRIPMRNRPQRMKDTGHKEHQSTQPRPRGRHKATPSRAVLPVANGNSWQAITQRVYGRDSLASAHSRAASLSPLDQ